MFARRDGEGYPSLNMTMTFLVPGYGIPKDILTDRNYDRYLSFIFNAIYDASVRRSSDEIVVIFSGGKTDLVPPYRRTEAGEMLRAFRLLMQRPDVRARTKRWKCLAETQSLSTPDNLLYAKRLTEKNALPSDRAFIFCEWTRRRRLSMIARHLLKGVRILPIDFDQSANRYRDPAFLKKKEKGMIAFDLWATEDPTRQKKHHALMGRKIAFLRKAGIARHVDAIHEWWKMEAEEIRKMMAK